MTNKPPWAIATVNLILLGIAMISLTLAVNWAFALGMTALAVYLRPEGKS